MSGEIDILKLLPEASIRLAFAQLQLLSFSYLSSQKFFAMYMLHLCLVFVGISQGSPVHETAFVRRLNNGVGVTPAMGFNNWNAGLSESWWFLLLNMTDARY
jgi:hypothetical protein